MQNILIFLVFIFGTIIGSFLNVVILRLPEDRKLTGRSACGSCGHILGVLDLVPVLSYVFLRGRCRYCSKRFSSRYALIEMATGILFAAAYCFVKPVNAAGFLMLAQLFILIGACVVTFVVDIEHQIILVDVVLSSTAAIVAINLILDIILKHSLAASGSLFFLSLGGAIVGSLPVYFLYYVSIFWTKEAGSWMGFGDVYLMLLLGSFAGLRLVGLVLFLGILIGGAVSVFLLTFGNKTLKSRVPFGAFLVPAAIFTIFFGESILRWYLAILGF